MVDRVVVPPLSDLGKLRQPLTAGEHGVLQWFLEILPPSWEIYIQPHLNGLRPDFVLLHRTVASPSTRSRTGRCKGWIISFNVRVRRA